MKSFSFRKSKSKFTRDELGKRKKNKTSTFYMCEMKENKQITE